MLFFAKQIVLGEGVGPHVEKIAMEGAAHMTLVFGAILVWRAPRRARDVLLLMVFLNALWTLADLVYIPLVNLDELDFYVKVVVNAILAVGLAVAGRRAGILERSAPARTPSRQFRRLVPHPGNHRRARRVADRGCRRCARVGDAAERKGEGPGFVRGWTPPTGSPRS
jgi:hypothetical protein